MKNISLAFIGPGKLGLVEGRLASPKPGRVLVRIKACGICAGDVHTFRHPAAQQKYPAFFGHEGSGIVEAVGEGVTGFKEGDNVAVTGADQFAQRAVVPAEKLLKLPENTPHEHWIVEPVACVVNSLAHAGLSPGDEVAVIGCGFMGLLIVQGLRHFPLSSLLAVEKDSRRLGLAGEFGATDLIGKGGEAGLRELARSKGGMDIVFESAGAADALALSSELLRRAGTLVMFAWHHEPRKIDASRWHGGGYRVLNTSPMFAADFYEFFRRAIKLMKRGVFDLKPLVTHVSPAEHAQEIFEIAAAQKDGYVKGVITF